jgi:hypothetical protein
MSINTPSPSPIPVEKVRSFDAGKVSFIALVVGIAGILVAVAGFLFYSPYRVSMSGLIAVIFWLSIALGMLFMVMLHHIFDAGWSTVIRRPLEHGLAALPWLGLLLLPLVLLSLFYDGGGFIWKWMASDRGPVADDVLYHAKSPYLNNPFFVLRFVLYFAIWIGLAWAFRHASFSQDRDGDPKWTTMNRKMAAAGLILGALTVSFAAMDWIKSLDYHWFSTMFGVWYFAGSMRGAFAVTVIMCVLLVKYGPFQGLFKQTHLYEIGRMMLAFTIFWAYISFSQYFLILNANIPEETFFYVVREQGNWWNVGLVLIFANFFVPFIFLLFYANKISTVSMVGISCWILLFHLVDIYYNILPSKLDNWIPVYNFPVFDVALLWDLAALVGVGGICVWAALRSFSSQRIIPIRDPRILESVHHHG